MNRSLQLLLSRPLLFPFLPRCTARSRALSVFATAATRTASSTVRGPQEAMNSSQLLIEPTLEGIDEAASLLRSGQLVAFPTETVYGLGANALNETAVRSIFTAKGRPLTDPLIVHVSEPQHALQLVQLSSEEHRVFSLLSAACWPGPLTLIARAAPAVPPLVTAQTGYVGVRCPAHPLALRLLRAAGVPVAAPSANRFGHVSPTAATHVLADLSDSGVKVLNGEAYAKFHQEKIPSGNLGGGEDWMHSGQAAPGASPQPTCRYGIESTVVRIDGDNRSLLIFRPGAISARRLSALLAEGDMGSKTQLTGLEGWTVCTVQRQVPMHNVDASKTPLAEAAAGKSGAIGTAACTSTGKGEEEEGKKEGELGQDPPISNAEKPSGECEGHLVPSGKPRDAIVVGQQAPGQAITHYAPACPCHMVKGVQVLTQEQVQREPPSEPDALQVNTTADSTPNARVDVGDTSLFLSFSQLRNEVVVLDFAGQLQQLHNVGTLAYKDLSPDGSCVEAAQALFHALRWAESIDNARMMLVADVTTGRGSNTTAFSSEESVDDEDMRAGLADRLFRSCSGSTVLLRIS